MILNTVGYRVEGVGDNDEVHVTDVSLPGLLDGVFDLADRDNDFKYYRDEIMSRGPIPHVNFLCADSVSGPVAVSIWQDELNERYISLVRTAKGNSRFVTPYTAISTSWWRRLLRLGPSWYDVLRDTDSNLPLDRLRKVADPRLPQALLSMEEQQQIKGFKFGVLYAKDGQTKEDEMFANIETSPEFEEFLDFLGNRVKLDSWKKFRGGLDVRSGTTGSHSIYREFNNNPMMFHVSTMLPFNPKDKQQLERKRHIGNDIVVVIFQDGDTVYKPTTISSRQVHVVLVVKAVHVAADPMTRYYRLGVVSRDDVPEFGPDVPKNAVFKKGDEFLQFFYAKLLNAERACYKAPILDNKLTRTRIAMLKDICQSFYVI